jgi:hypothetical protein
MVRKAEILSRDGTVQMRLTYAWVYHLSLLQPESLPEDMRADFEAIKELPVFLASREVGHGGTFAEKNGGAFGVVGVAWLKWQLKGDKEAAKTFLGGTPGLAADTKWSVKAKNLK